MTIALFIKRWSESGASERANKDSFLLDLCDVLGVPRPSLRDPLIVSDRNHYSISGADRSHCGA